MSIKLVVTRGYGNNTFNGTIKDVVTRGYTIGAAVTSIVGGCWAKGEVYNLGFKSGETYHPGFKSGQRGC